MEVKVLKDKLSRIDEMLAKVESAVQDGNPVLEMPSASGLIARCQTEGISMAAAMLEEFQKRNIAIWLDGRSLLASCRTQKLLPWETVVEVGVLEDGWDALKDGLLDEIGYVLDGQAVKPAEKPQSGSICPEVKINVWTRDAQTLHLERAEGETAWTTEECIFPLKERVLNGLAFASPSNAWSILEAEFGSGWQKIV